MTSDMWAVIGVRRGAAGAILTQGASLRAEIRTLRGRIDHLADELRALSERVAASRAPRPCRQDRADGSRRRSRRSSSFSSVVRPSVRVPSSRSAWRTQFQIDRAVGSNSRDSDSGVRPPTHQVDHLLPVLRRIRPSAPRHRVLLPKSGGVHENRVNSTAEHERLSYFDDLESLDSPSQHRGKVVCHDQIY